MSLPIPLTIKLATARGTRDVTREARDLVMRWTDPGGYASCQVGLDRPLSLMPDEVAYYGALTVHDARNASTVWDGRLEDPGRSASADGQVWSLAALGGQAHTRDRIVPLIYVDRQLQGAWDRVVGSNPGVEGSVGTDPGDLSMSTPPALVLRYPEGVLLATNDYGVMRYTRLHDAALKAARVDYTWDAGAASADTRLQLAVFTVDGLGEFPRDDAWSTAGGGSVPKVVVTNWTNARDIVDIRIKYTGAGGRFTNSAWWATVRDLVVVAMRYTADGAEKTTGYTTNTVLASEVVADLLGRVLTKFDGAGATVFTTSHPIEQMAYPDGADANKVLTDLLALEAGHTWRVWERDSLGKYRFEFRPIETQVRYEADVTDGYDSQGSADGLYNAVTVRWRDPAGKVQTTTVTSTVPILTNADLTRTGQIDLGDEVGSAADASRAGEEWLAQRQYPPNAGRLRIARPIWDIEDGRMVMPWEIRPGLIRVRGILPSVDALNATARDGVTIFRIATCEYRVSDGAATLELDSRPRTVPVMLAQAAGRPVWRRR